MNESKLSARSHAYLFAVIAKRIVDTYGEEGKDVIREGVIHYGKQRGSRMAQRAIRNGAEPDIPSYILYGEWIAEPGDMNIETPSISPDVRFLYKKCPWYDVWHETGLLEKYGYLYCKYVDEAIAAGFNPAIRFDILSARGCGASVCDMRFRNANLSEEKWKELQAKAKEFGNRFKRPWDYHCAHLFKALWEVIISRLGINGEKQIILALEDFTEKYGKEAADEFLRLVSSDYNKAD